VSGQFGFDFTTDTVTNYKFTAPDYIFDSSVPNESTVIPFTSSGTSYLDINFNGVSVRRALDLVVNPAITEFFTQDLPADGELAVYFSAYACGRFLCPDSDVMYSHFASGAVSTPIPEPSTWWLMTAGFGLLGYAGYRRAGKGVQWSAAA
jgi:hypothetical protein